MATLLGQCLHSTHNIMNCLRIPLFQSALVLGLVSPMTIQAEQVIFSEIQYNAKAGLPDFIEITNNTATVNVEAGTLAANGTIAASSINIQDGANLTTGEAERLNDGVALNADGTVSLGGNETIGDLSGSGQVQNNGNDLTVNQTSDQEFSGNITDSGGLTKQGEANLTLGGDNDFTGTANISEGALTVSGALATNTINVANGATLTTTGSTTR